MRKCPSLKMYSDDAEYYTSVEEVDRIEIILQMLGRDKKVLDLGCYNGHILRRMVEQGNRVTGVDASDKLIRKLNTKGYDVRLHNLENKLPFKTASYDAVFAGEIIEHLVDTELFLSEIHRVLRKNGLLILTTPNVASLDRRFMLLFNKNPFFEASLSYPRNGAGHLRFFNSTLLCSFLNAKGFEVVELRTEFVQFTNTLRSKLLGRLFPTAGYSLILNCRRKMV